MVAPSGSKVGTPNGTTWGHALPNVLLVHVVAARLELGQKFVPVARMLLVADATLHRLHAQPFRLADETAP